MGFRFDFTLDSLIYLVFGGLALYFLISIIAKLFNFADGRTNMWSIVKILFYLMILGFIGLDSLEMFGIG